MWFKKEKKTGKNVYLLLDRSASMATEWTQTLESINTYVSKLEDDVNVHIAAFDSPFGETPTSYDVIRETSAIEYKKITAEEIQPRGSTPLFDAAVNIMHRMLADNPEKAVLVIMTDGEENSSRECNLATVKSKLASIEEKQWPTVYLGAGFNEVERYASSTFNIAKAHTFNTTASTRSSAMADLGTKSMNYFSGSVSGSIALDFSDKEKSKYKGETESAN